MATKLLSMAAAEHFTNTITWNALAGGDDGNAGYIGDLESVSAQAIGDGTSVSIQGSNDGTHWAAFGSAVTLTLSGGQSPVVPVPTVARYIRPVVTGGSATQVIIHGRRMR